MPKMTSELVGIDLDLAAEQQRIRNRMGQAIRTGARRWVAATAGKVPVFSGMARASLFKIAELANTTIVVSPLKAPSRIPLGQALGTAEIQDRGPLFQFTVRVAVPHYVIQETESTRPKGSPKAPFRSFDAGLRAFQLFAATVKLPAVVFKPITIARI